MSQKEKAREVAQAHEFSVLTAANGEETMSVLNAAAAAAGTGGLKGTIKRTGLQMTDTGFRSAWVLKGPGGLVDIASFTIDGSQAGRGGMDVRMKIGHFTYQKGQVFMKPTLNGGKTIRRFGEIAMSELAAKPSDPGSRAR